MTFGVVRPALSPSVGPAAGHGVVLVRFSHSRTRNRGRSFSSNPARLCAGRRIGQTTDATNRTDFSEKQSLASAAAVPSVVCASGWATRFVAFHGHGIAANLLLTSLAYQSHDAVEM